MINAMKIAGEIWQLFLKIDCRRNQQKVKRGFIHPVRLVGLAEKCAIDFIIP
jgi:tripeptide aminopeptidase